MVLLFNKLSHDRCVFMRRGFIFAIIMAIFMTGCASQRSMPSVDVPVDALNKDVRVFPPQGWNTFQVNDSIGLVIDVTGDEPVIFPPDFGVRIFRYADEQWVDVQQVPTEYGGGDIILAPSQGDLFMMGGTSIYPILPENKKPVLLRVFVFGHVYREGEASGEKVGAYTDVVLKP